MNSGGLPVQLFCVQCAGGCAETVASHASVGTRCKMRATRHAALAMAWLLLTSALTVAGCQERTAAGQATPSIADGASAAADALATELTEATLNANGCAPSGSGGKCGNSLGTCANGLCRHTDEKGYEWTRVPAGVFWMGCNVVVEGECGVYDSPQHQVELSSYWIGVYEVTAAAYAKCAAAGAPGCTVPLKTGGGALDLSTYAASGKEQHPINYVTWSQAQAVCRWLGGDLPTEAQWEKAARGGCEVYAGKDCKSSEGKYPWGNSEPVFGQHAVFFNKANTYKLTTYAVGTGSVLGASPYGSYDMAGNVLEWTRDYADLKFYQTATATTKDPRNDVVGDYVVLRGGSMMSKPDTVTTSWRSSTTPDSADSEVGVRCVKLLGG